MKVKRPNETDLREIARPAFQRLFWSKVDIGEPGACWQWMAGGDGRGYGVASVRGRSIRAHRVALAIADRPPGNMLALHHCDNKGCVNPRHLYVGDHSDNLADEFGRNGIRRPNAKLTPDDVRRVRALVKSDLTYQQIGERFGVTRAAISEIARKVTWSDIATTCQEEHENG